MQYVSAVRAALKAVAPVVAVPVEGHAPICVRTKLLKGALRGVTIDRVEIIKHPEDSNGRYRLKVTGHAGNVRTSSIFTTIARYMALEMIGEWAIKERAKALKIINQGVLSAKEQRAMKLRKAEEAGIAELRQAEKVIRELFAEAKEHINPVSTPIDDEARAELAQEYSTFRANRRNRKRGAVIRWKLKTLREKVAAITKLEGPRRGRKVVKLRKKQDTLRYAAMLYQIGELEAQYKALYPPAYWTYSWQDKRPHDQAYKLSNTWRYNYFDRVSLVKQLTNALADRRALTPPEDVEEQVAA